MTPDEDMTRGEILMSNALEKLSRAATAATSSSSCSSSPFPSFQDSYITSEHCYQKPRAYYPAVEQRLVVETRQGSELEDSMRSTEELLEREQRFGGLLETDKPKSTGTSNKVSERTLQLVISLKRLKRIDKSKQTTLQRQSISTIYTVCAVIEDSGFTQVGLLLPSWQHMYPVNLSEIV